MRHLGWRRFKCRLCRYTAYNRSDCTTHLRKVHIKSTAGKRDVSCHIVDLETRMSQTQELSLLTRVERSQYDGSRDTGDQSASPKHAADTSNHGNDQYNISTRRNTRVFNTKPFVREEEQNGKDEEELSESEEEEAQEEGDEKNDSLLTLRTRKGAYSKPDLLKRKRADSSRDEDAEPGETTAKKKRADAGTLHR